MKISVGLFYPSTFFDFLPNIQADDRQNKTSDCSSGCIFSFLAFMRLEYNDHLWLITEKLLAHYINLWFSLKREKEKGRSEYNSASDMIENTNGYYIKSQWTFDSEEVPFKIRSVYHVPVINMIAARAERAEVSLIYINNRQQPHPQKSVTI